MGKRSALSSSTILVRTSERDSAVRTLHSVLALYPDCLLTQETFWGTVGRRLFTSTTPQRMTTVRYGSVKTKFHLFARVCPMASGTGQASVQKELLRLAKEAQPAKICTEPGMTALVTFGVSRQTPLPLVSLCWCPAPATRASGTHSPVHTVPHTAAKPTPPSQRNAPPCVRISRWDAARGTVVLPYKDKDCQRAITDRAASSARRLRTTPTFVYC